MTQCTTCNGSLLPGGVSGYRCPECNPEEPALSDDNRNELRHLYEEVIGERRCGQCGLAMAHFRLSGWRCRRCG